MIRRGAAVVAMALLAITACGDGLEGASRLNSDEVRPIVEQLSDAALQLLADPPPLGSGVAILDECNDYEGDFTGYISIMNIFNREPVPRDVGVRDLRAVHAAWTAAGYRNTYPARWDDDFIVFIFTDTATGVDFQAHLTSAGQLHIGVFSPCVRPGPSDKASMSATKKPRAAKADGPPVEDIRKILG